MKLTQLFRNAIAQVTGSYQDKIDYYDKTAHSKAGIVSYRYACYVRNMTDEEVEKVQKIIAEQYTGKFTVHLLDCGFRSNPKLCLTVKLPVPHLLKGATIGTNKYDVYANGQFTHTIILSEYRWGNCKEQGKLQALKIVAQLTELGYTQQNIPGMYSKTTQL